MELYIYLIYVSVLLVFFTIARLTKRKVLDIMVFTFSILLSYLVMVFKPYVITGHEVVSQSFGTTVVYMLEPIKVMFSYDWVLIIIGLSLAIVSIVNMIYEDYSL